VAQGSNSTAGFPSVILPSQGFGTTANYTVEVTDNGGCVNTITKTITSISNPGTLTITPSLCTNPATLSVSGGTGSYTWTLPNASTNTANPLTIAQGGTYSVTGTSPSSGCKISATTTFVFNGTIVPNIVQSDPCQTSVIATASPSGNFTYRWSDTQGNLSYGSSIAVTTTDIYSLVITDTQTGCSTPNFQKQVNVIGTITASLAASLACDDGKPFTLTATVNTSSPVPAPTFAWALNGTTIAGATSNPLNQTSAGTYKVTASQSTCQATASIQIVKAPVPIGNLIPQDIICNSPDNANPDTKQRVLDPGIFVSYDWFKNDVTLNWTQRKYTATSEGVYRVDLTNDYGCTNSNTINLVQSCEPVVTAPNAFRPASNEPTNKTFKVFNFFIDKDKFEIVIFNRWGEPVFESKNADFTWDGGYNSATGGVPLPGGTYAYIVRYVSTFHPDQGVQEKRGGVVLLR
jgi:gliding motility-associated-like protein